MTRCCLHLYVFSVYSMCHLHSQELIHVKSHAAAWYSMTYLDDTRLFHTLTDQLHLLLADLILHISKNLQDPIHFCFILSLS